MSAAPRRRRVLLAALVLLAGLAGALAWWLLRPPALGPAAAQASRALVSGASQGASTDLAAVLPLNNRGVGLMERFEYASAVRVFEQVVGKAPAWLPGRINLGIALLNAGGTSEPGQLKRTAEVFEDVLRLDPDNPYAHHCLGVLLMYQKDPAEAIRHFEAVTRIDPRDASAWFFLGTLVQDDEQRLKCFREALRFDPYHTGALYQVALLEGRSDPKKSEELLKRFQDLEAAQLGHPTAIKYGEMGKYGAVFGGHGFGPAAKAELPVLLPRWPAVRLAEGTRWATPADLDELRRLVRRRFGATMVVLDYDGDGRPDLFLAGAVVEGGQVRDLLLHNEGDGGFVDVTRAAGLGGARPTLGATVADFDNDGRPDLLLTGAGVQKLYRNTGAGKFEDVTARAGLDQVKSVCLGAAFVDLDQDGDLDLVLACYAPGVAEAVKGLKGEGAASGQVALFLNIGEAPPQMKGGKGPVGLTCRWKRADELWSFVGPGNFTGLVVLDIDDDGDLDVLVLHEGRAGIVARNDRLLKFSGLVAEVAPADRGLTLDPAHGGRSDLLLLAGSRQTRLVRWEPFSNHPLQAPPLLQASAFDLNLDGWTDVVGLTTDGRVIVLVNEAGRLNARFLPSSVADAVAVAPLVTLGEAGRVVPKLAVWSGTKGLALLEPAKAGNHALALRLDGRRGVEPGGALVRSNADGIGARVAAQAGGLWTGIENTTLSAGLGQSRQPLLLGLGRHGRADVVRLRWPDGTIQAELDLPAGAARIRQSNRKRTSCPVLFAWDGRRFRFVNDLLGAGSLSELLPDGSTRPPRGEESLKIEPGQLAPRDGKYLLDLAEPMDEITYLDHLQLVVIDHPAGVQVYPDERFATGGPAPTQALIAFEKTLFPVRATDHRGRDVTRTLSRWDRDTVDGFRKRAWLGFAEEHFVDLDFGDRLKGLKPGQRVFLCLAGWTDYPYPESIWAATQAGVAMLPPVLEQEERPGRWRKVCDVGFPAGLPRMMLRELTGLLRAPGALRLRTNLQVYWDQAFLAVDRREVGERVRTLDVSRASLHPCGLHREYSPDGKLPTIYDHDRFDRDPVVRPAGRLTRHGEVTELLRRADDRFVVFGPGDRLRVEFDASKLPALPAGWRRGFVLRARGYCKDVSPFTATGATVEPLPFRAMRRYPPGPDERYPDTPLHRDYLRRYQTRQTTAGVRPPGAPRRRAALPAQTPARTP
jgi:tetratricopeptide (TPR) repeat protein